jgi:hypothetical protein
MSCRIRETLTGRLRTVVLENELLAVTVLADKGADIAKLEHRASGVDVLWKSPWGMREPGSGFAPAPNSNVAWLEAYEGGWQELFPNGGDACVYQGVELPFHGEASALPWSVEVLADTPGEVSVRFAVRLFRSPFRLTRTMTVRAGSPVLTLEESAVNEGAIPLAAMWSHHPALGGPFLTPSCRLDTDARTVWADPDYDTPNGRLQPGGRWEWPNAQDRAGNAVDLRQVPAGPTDMLAYLGDFAEGWYALTNPDLGFGVALVWPASVFPHAWLWQELRGSTGFPWYGISYTMAVEPASTVPGHGVVAAMERTGTHLTFAPGERRDFTLRAVFYDAGAGHGVRHVAPDGRVTLEESKV